MPTLTPIANRPAYSFYALRSVFTTLSLIATASKGPPAWVSITLRAHGSKGLIPHLSLDRAKPGLIAVNGTGKRFVNEAASYHDFVQGMYASHATSPTIPAYLICEATFVARYGLGAIHPGTKDVSKFEREGYLMKAATLDALADKIKVKPTALRETIQQYNQFARNGRTSPLGRVKPS